MKYIVMERDSSWCQGREAEERALKSLQPLPFKDSLQTHHSPQPESPSSTGTAVNGHHTLLGKHLPRTSEFQEMCNLVLFLVLKRFAFY